MEDGKKADIPPFFVFFKHSNRSVIFKGLAVPGACGIKGKSLRIVKQGKNKDIDNYEAIFTLLKVNKIDRRWLSDLREGKGKTSVYAPQIWMDWIEKVEYIHKREYPEYIKEEDIEYAITIERNLEKKVNEARILTKEERKRRVISYKLKPSRKEIKTIVYERNPYVIAEVLDRAGGFCEVCGNKAPFIRASNDTPYLEVHHKIRLADGGLDTVENTIAVCPNCHRELHFGIKQ